MDYTQVGPAIILALSCIGAAIGCAIAGMASHGVMSRIEEGHGKFIGISAIPSSQAIYGVVLLFLMNNSLKAGKITALAGVGIGTAIGLTILFSAIYQGLCAATAIQATAKQPGIFGKSVIALGIVESFALFAFAFTASVLL
ncbi:MAG: V-type sodium ATPase subunit K [Chlamydiae bacterium]|nr:V-type sodium ATPase subunit K [Chlamydiota bacterium]